MGFKIKLKSNIKWDLFPEYNPMTDLLDLEQVKNIETIPIPNYNSWQRIWQIKMCKLAYKYNCCELIINSRQ